MADTDELEELRAELAGAREEAARLAERLADREAWASELAQTAVALRGDLQAAHTERTAAVAHYREALLAAAPELPPELVTGDTVAAIEAAAQAARQVVARVREQVATAAVGRPVPSGGVTRQPPDTSALSPSEKIRLGLAARE